MPEIVYKNMDPSMANMYQGQETEKAGRMVDEVITSAPLLRYLDSRTTQLNTIEGWRAKSIGLFGPRPYGFGAESITSNYERYTASLYNYDGKLEVELALLRDQANSGIPNKDFFAREGTNVLRGGMVLLDKVLFYGTDLLDFVSPGLTQLIAPYMTVSANPAYQSFTESDYNTTEYKNAVKDTSGTSVYFIVKMNKGLEVIWGNGEGIRRGQLKDTEVQAKSVKGRPGSFEGKVQHFTAKMGLLNNELYFIGRLKNITKDTGLSDAMIQDAIAQIFNGFDHKPTALFMNDFAVTWLRKSRHTNQDYVAGVSPNTVYAKKPTEVDGIPIIVDNNILLSETKEAIRKDGEKTFLEASGKTMLKY